MMDRREADKLLADLFKRNAPAVNDEALRERVGARLLRLRTRSQKNRIARTVALAFASIVLAGGLALGAYETLGYFRGQPELVFSDLVPATGSTPSGSASSHPLLARVSPVTGTAVLERVKSAGSSDSGSGADSVPQVRGRVEVYRLTMSQPLISGTLEITFDLAGRPDGRTAIQGSWVLRTERGSWECRSWAGSLSADGAEQFCLGNGSGTGRFEGLLLLLQWHAVKNVGSSSAGETSSATAQVSGWIQAAR
jgi:hypothetical protein